MVQERGRRATVVVMLLFARAAAASLALIACSSPPVEPPPPPTPCEPGTRPAVALPRGECAELSGAFVARQVGHPGRAIEIDVRVEQRSAPAARDFGHCLTLGDANGRPLPTCTQPRPAEGAVTAILMAPPSDAAGESAALAVLEELLAARPPGERAALSRWGASVEALDTFTTDRARTLERARGGLGVEAGTLAPAASAWTLVADDLRAAGGDARAWLRALIVLAPSRTLAEVPAPAAPDAIVTLALAASWPEPALDRFTSASELSSVIDAHVAAGFVGIGHCGDGRATNLVLSLAGGTSSAFELRESTTDEVGGECDEWRTARGERDYPRRIELIFDDAQRAAYQARLAASDRLDFDLSIRLGDAAPVPARAHLRGANSLFCERRSYVVDLQGPLGRAVLPGSSTDELILIALCLDPYYVNYPTGYQVLQELGLFPLEWGLVELVLDGQSRGVYVVLENFDDELRRDHPRLRSVVRRRNDYGGAEPELEWAEGGDAAGALATYEAILGSTGTLSGPELEGYLREHLDLDMYLRWNAAMVALQNGDHIDELFFYASQSRTASGQPVDYFSFMGWDPDDNFAACHYGGSWSIVDPNELLYCTEGNLEHRVLVDPHVYELFAGELEAVLARLDEARFAAITARTEQMLLPFFEDPAIVAASIELHALDPAATTPAGAQAAIRGALERMRAAHASWRATLLERAAAYRASAP